MLMGFIGQLPEHILTQLSTCSCGVLPESMIAPNADKVSCWNPPHSSGRVSLGDSPFFSVPNAAPPSLSGSAHQVFAHLPERNPSAISANLEVAGDVQANDSQSYKCTVNTLRNLLLTGNPIRILRRCAYVRSSVPFPSSLVSGPTPTLLKYLQSRLTSNEEVLESLKESYEQALRRDDVVTGAGGRFSGGFDISAFGDIQAGKVCDDES